MTTVQSFYSGKAVLITGATGFLGKALLEKLLRSTEVQQIYVLIREKSQRSIHQRLQDLLKECLFEELTRKVSHSVLLQRVTAVRGDCGLPELGLSDSDRELLLQNVELVFHCAATVRFTEPLRVAARINVEATQDLLELARQMVHLKSFVHVSTTFVGCTQSFTDEHVIVVPKSPLGGGSAVDASRRIRLMDDQELLTLTPRIIGKYPNTYTYTKSLAEELLVSEAADLPVAIFRPGIVLSSYAEPYPGWIGNTFGIPSVMLGLMMGLIHILKYCNTAAIAAVPIDYCVNALIACGFRTAYDKRRNKPTVYNCVAEATNPITWGELFGRTIDLARKQPTRHLLWYPFLLFTESYIVQQLLQALLHTLPAMIYDLLTSFQNRKKKSQNIVKHQHKLFKVVDYFLMRHWNIATENLRCLWSSLDRDDQQLFPFDMLELDWEQHNYDSVMGVRRQFLNEYPHTLDNGRKRYGILRLVHYFVILMVIGFLLMTLHSLISLITPSWLSVAGLYNTMNVSFLPFISKQALELS